MPQIYEKKVVVGYDVKYNCW